MVKNQPANAGDTAQSPVWEDSTCWGAAEPMRHNCQAYALEPILQLLRPTCSRAHALQQGYMCAQSCQILCDPMGCSPPVFSVHGIFQARIPGWNAISYSRGSSWPRDQTCVSCISCNSRQIPPGKPMDALHTLLSYKHEIIINLTWPLLWLRIVCSQTSWEVITQTRTAASLSCCLGRRVASGLPFAPQRFLAA